MTVATDLATRHGKLRRYFLKIDGVPYILNQRVADPTGDDAAIGIPTMHPLDADVICAYRFDEAAGTDNAVDASGNGYDMTEHGDPPLGDYVLFGGSRNVRTSVVSGHHFQVADAPALRRDTFTAACWIYLTQVATYTNFVGEMMWKGVYAAEYITDTWQLGQFDLDGGSARSYRFHARVRTAAGGASGTAITAYNPSATVAGWNHVGMTYDGTWLRLYVNGQLVASTENTTGTATLLQGNGELAVPSHYNGGHFDIDDAAYYENVKPAAWFQARYRQGLNCLRVPSTEYAHDLDLKTMTQKPSAMTFELDNVDDPADG